MKLTTAEFCLWLTVKCTNYLFSLHIEMAAVRTPIARAGLNNYNHDIDDPEFQKTANIRRVAHRQVDILEIFGDHPKYHTQSGTSHEDITVSNQFKYFRKEMIELALVSGVTVPMDILEDNSGKILDFVRHAGPKFAIDLLQNETENIRLLRVTLSLLLIVITFLRRRLLGQLTSMLENVTLDSLLAWSAHALLDVADGVAISAGVNLLLHTHVEDIHILAFDLLVHVISVSEDAARQLLLPPNSYKYETGTHEREDSKSKASLLSASPAHSKLGDSNRKSFSGKNLFGEIDSQPSMSSPTGHPKSPSAMTATLPHRDHNTCLSYMLSICALYRNRLVVVSSCAEVIITLVCGSGDHLVAETIAKTPTCYLPSSLKDSHSGSKRVGVRNSSSSSQPKQYGVIHHSKHEEERVSSYGIVEWAGLKLMLKMLVRLVKCMSQDGEAIGHKEPATNSAAQDYSDLSPVSGQQPNVPRTHKKVLIAVLALIHYSRAVANYTLALPGAENIIKTSAAFYKSSSSITNWYQKGLTAFHNAREEKRLAAAAVAARAAALTAHKQSITANAVPLSGIKTVGSNSGGNSINDDGSIWSRSLESVEAGKSMAKSPQDHRHSASGLVPGAHSKRSRGQTYHEGKAPDGYFTRVGRPTSQHVLNISSNISSHSSNNDLLRSTGETALAQSHRPYTAPNPQSGRPLGSVNKGSGLEWSHFDRLSESANLGIPAMQGACFGNFLKSLPGIPKIPGRTSAVSILAAGDEVVYEASVETKELFDAIASKELRKIENKGSEVSAVLVFYYSTATKHEYVVVTFSPFPTIEHGILFYNLRISRQH